MEQRDGQTERQKGGFLNTPQNFSFSRGKIIWSKFMHSYHGETKKINNFPHYQEEKLEKQEVCQIQF